MIISHKHKFISLDPPKTGTNYRQNLLWKHGEHVASLQHGNLIEIKKHFINYDFSDYFVFTFVRNPWSRYLSLYQQEGRPLDPNSFQSWINSHVNHKNQYKMYRDQSHWYMQNGVTVTDLIGSLESMSKDLKSVLNKINLSINLPNKKSNQSKITLNVKDFYNQESIDIISNKEKEVIKLKGYDF